jgi:PKHD-type hydroxylase|tara:strand:+ start:741 stop:1415 length:675 start_codon:yes stop_codon:yes gene_type:complete
MNLKNAYWYFTSRLGDRFCDDLIQHGNSKKELIGVTGGVSADVRKRNKNKKIVDVEVQENLKKKDIKNLKKQRDSNIVWLNDKWLYDEITPFFHMANQNAGWNFQIDYFESMQFTKYKLNQFYDWHQDPMPVPYNSPHDPNFHGKIRKISGIVQLSDPKDYKGGELEIQPRMHADPTHVIQTKKHFKPRGSIIIFPSHLWHRVKPVTKGTRYSLVIWSLGYPFR